MKCNHIFSITLILVMFRFLAVNSAHATTWNVTQLTNNSYTDYNLRIYGSNVVWEGRYITNLEVFLYHSNGIVDGSGNAKVLNNWNPPSEPASQIIPEPVTLGLLLISGLVLLRRRK